MKTRKEPTAEQKARAEERRERFATLAKAVAEMTDEQRAELVAKVGAIVTCEQHTLTVTNSCLILMQLSGASMVGGFHQWLAHGRSVKRGERGLMLWVPTGKKGDADAQKADDATEGADKAKRRGFVMGTVFDVSQTEPSK